MANVYEVDPLAEDCEDERRIVKAAAWSARKAKSEKGKKTWGRRCEQSVVKTSVCSVTEGVETCIRSGEAGAMVLMWHRA